MSVGMRRLDVLTERCGGDISDPAGLTLSPEGRLVEARELGPVVLVGGARLADDALRGRPRVMGDFPRVELVHVDVDGRPRS